MEAVCWEDKKNGSLDRWAISRGELPGRIAQHIADFAGENDELYTFGCRIWVTSWAIDCQAPLSMGFSRWEPWRGLPFPSPGDLPDPGIKLGSPGLQADSLPSEPPAKPPECAHTFANSSCLVTHVRRTVINDLRHQCDQCREHLHSQMRECTSCTNVESWSKAF